jgi:hypothetical protein
LEKYEVGNNTFGVAEVSNGQSSVKIDLWDARGELVAAYERCGGRPDDASGLDRKAYAQAMREWYEALGLGPASSGEVERLVAWVFKTVEALEKKDTAPGTPSSPASTARPS